MKLQVGNKILNIRKWKGKDKKKFLKSVKNNLNQKDIMNSLVYDCIEEKDIILTIEELKYVLSRIRAISLGEDITIEFYCDDCGKVFEKTFQLKDIFSYSYSELNKINIPGALIKFGPIKNKDFYFKKVEEDPAYEFILKIEEFNGNDSFTLEELEDTLDNLDIDILEEIIKQYNEAKFKILDINTVKCSCGKEEKYMFDELPGFLPESWFNEHSV